MTPIDVIQVHDKYGHHTIRAEDGTIGTAALQLLGERIEEGYWYDNWDDGDPKNQWETRAKAILERRDGREAWAFLRSRSDFEYEYVESAVI